MLIENLYKLMRSLFLLFVTFLRLAVAIEHGACFAMRYFMHEKGL